MAESDSTQYLGNRRVNMKIWGGVPNFDQNLSRHHVSCQVVLQLHGFIEKKKEQHGQSGKISLSYI